MSSDRLYKHSLEKAVSAAVRAQVDIDYKGKADDAETAETRRKALVAAIGLGASRKNLAKRLMISITEIDEIIAEEKPSP